MFFGSASAQNGCVKGKQCVHGHLYYAVPVLIALFDYVAILLAELVAYTIGSALRVGFATTYAVPSSYEYIYVPAFALFVMLVMDSYQRMRPAADIYKSVVKAVAVVVVLLMALVELFGVTGVVPRSFFVLFAVLLLVMVLALRTAGMLLAKRCCALHTPVLLVGAGLTAERLVRFFEEDWGYCYEVVGFLDDAPKSAVLAKEYRILGGLAGASEVLQSTGVENVIITAPGLPKEKLVQLVAKIRPYTRTLALVPDLIGTPFGSVDIDMIFSEEMLLLKSRNNLAVRSNRVIKRIFDLVCTICGGLVILPVILFIALLVAIDNRGHVIFAHKRIGKDGKIFRCYKFQTMVADAARKLEEYLANNPEARREWEESFKLTNDPRVTKLGGFLRKTSLDELPQLFNVLKGEMSLVGPRPIVEKEISRYGEYFAEYKMVLPGITGMWQASGRSDTTYEERVAMDTWYVRNWSVWIDIMYLVRTVGVVLGKKGAY